MCRSNGGVVESTMNSFDTSSLKFVYGPVNAEDVVRLPGVPWVVASHLNADITSGMPPTRYGPGPLESIRIDTHEVRRLYPSPESTVDWDRVTYPDCPEPPSSLSSHGLNVRPLGNKSFRLYVNNHGGRHSVEIIDVAVDGERLRSTWRGGVVAPLEDLGVWPNGVAPLPGEGFILSGFNVATWRPKYGWKRFARYQGTRPGERLVFGPGTGGMSNGVELSRDGEWVFIADTLRQSVFRMPMIDGEQSVLKLNFGVNNLRWGEDGRLYVAGAVWPKFEHAEDEHKLFEQAQAVTGIIAAAIDPETLAVDIVVNDAHGFAGTYGATSTALQFENQLWLSSEISDRIAILSLRT
jgi:hypothetical protein